MPHDPFLNQSQDRGGPQMPLLQAGQRLFNRRYELLRPLGAGGMGVVWLARDHTEETEVALKFLPTVLVLQESEMKRLRDEVRAGKELRHPRLVATYGLEVEDGIAAIVMEYVPGQTLKEKLEAQERGFFEPEEIAAWVKDACDGLSYLHEEAKRIHRDLKPANIIIDAAGHARLMDFGISHRIQEGVSRHSRTSDGHVSGSSSTLAYASPQQLSGRPGDKSDDIYSLGATIYELLTGTPPFFRGGAEAVAIQIKTELPTAIMERRQELKAEGVNAVLGEALHSPIEQIVLDCLSKEREPRPAGANKVAQRFGVTYQPSLPSAKGTAASMPRQTPSPTPLRRFLKPVIAAGVVLAALVCAMLVPRTKTDLRQAPTSVASEDILIGEFASLTGREAAFGTSSHEGTQLAVEEINASGGILGRQVRLITKDDQSKAGEAANVVDQLISEDRVVAVLGEIASSRSLEAAPVCQRNGIPMISNGSNPKVTEAGDFIFRACFSDPYQGSVMASFATNTLKARKVAVFADSSSDYSLAMAKRFKDDFTRAGGVIAAEQFFKGGDKDFKGQLTAIQSAMPDAVFVPGYYPDAALICIQARQLGLNVPLLGGDGWESETLMQIGGTAVEGHYFCTHYAADATSTKARSFVDAYGKRYGGKKPDGMAALGYDAVKLLADAITRAQTTDGKRLRDALAATKNLEVMTGKMSLDALRDAIRPAVILQVKDGAFKYVETVAPEYATGDSAKITPQPATPAPPKPSTLTATKESPFTNSLGMKFVPVPINAGPSKGQRILFSIWETRSKDYAAFVKDSGYDAGENWKTIEYQGVPIGRGEGENAEESTHPASNVSHNDAVAFCVWLTKKDSVSGLIGPQDEYRLPSDVEWSYAVGIGDQESANASPKDKHMGVKDMYPWGVGFPPPAGSGNYADTTAKAKGTHLLGIIDGYTDGYPTTAPVGSFKANILGLYDMGGNSREHCADWEDSEQKYRVSRGASWDSMDVSDSLSSFRASGDASSRGMVYGFRCVLVVSGTGGNDGASASEPAVDSSANALTAFLRTPQFSGSKTHQVRLQRSHYFDNDVPNLDGMDCFEIKGPNDPLLKRFAFVPRDSHLGRELQNSVPWEGVVEAEAAMEWHGDGDAAWIELKSAKKVTKQ
ncbi:MAG: ABC transporter substrate-binding protein [Verrucomicrobiaceae bacterium]